jgi:putative nucleotidyltransferase with HDIG domain
MPLRLAAAVRQRFRRNAPARRAGWAVGFWLATALVLATAALPAQLSLRAGEVAPSTVKAPRDLIDRPTTARLRRAAEQQVPNVYRAVAAIQDSAMGNFDGDVGAVDSLRADAALSPAERMAQLRASVPLSVPDADYAAVLALGGPTLAALANATRADLAAAFEHGVFPDKLSGERQALVREVRSLPYASAAADWFANLGSSLLQPNEVVDQASTQRARARAADAVAPVMILKGQAIVHEGDRVTADDMVRLQDAGLLRTQGRAGVVLGAALLAAIIEAMAWAHLALFHRDVLGSERRLVLLGATAVAAMAAIPLALRLSAFLSPLPWAAILVAVAFGPQLAVFLTALLSLATGLLSHDLAAAAVTLVLGLAAAFSLRRIHQRSDLMRAGALAGASGAAAWLALALFLGQGLNHTQTLAEAGLTLADGLICGVLAIGTLPYVEYAFGLLTPMRLLELANPQQPLLHRLLIEAPGTYHHSLMVANLAEAACQAFGGDALLARVGAYYHDVGKIKRPYFFIENQLGGENPHDKLSPNLSALVITSHVRDGVDLAREHRLPEELIDFIRTHHGTTMVSYFYHRARQTGDCIEENFRYGGPIPETREQAVVMLADGVEATVRAMRETQPDKVEATVRGVVRERLDGGQLARADLTLRQLDQIVSTFVHVLNGIYHHRVEYPEQVMQEFRPERALRP